MVIYSLRNLGLIFHGSEGIQSEERVTNVKQINTGCGRHWKIIQRIKYSHKNAVKIFIKQTNIY